MSLFKKHLPMPKSEVIAALDVGTSKVCCAIARLSHPSSFTQNKNPQELIQQPHIKVLGVGYQLSRGLRGGHIIDLDALEDSILNAVHSAEQAAETQIHQLYVTIPGRWAQSTKIKVETQLSNQPVNESHLKRLLTLHQENSFFHDKHVIHVLPLSYQLDDVPGIRDPLGMIGEKLSATLNVVSAPTGTIRNLKACIGRCHLDIAGLVVAPYASGLSTLVEDELELGVTLIDIGAGQTTISSFYEGNLLNLTTIPIGGANITNDIARGLATPITQAERLKTLYGTLMTSSAGDPENIMVAQMGEIHSSYTHQIPKDLLIHIIRSRMEEIFEHIIKRVKSGEVDPLAFQRIVLTGGTSQLQGIREMATQFLNRQVRLGSPQGLSGTLDLIQAPSFSACAGLLHYGLQDYESNHKSSLLYEKLSFWQKLNMWIKQTF